MLKYDKRFLRYCQLCPSRMFVKNCSWCLGRFWLWTSARFLKNTTCFKQICCVSSSLGVFLLFYILCTNTFSIFPSSMNGKLCGTVVPPGHFRYVFFSMCLRWRLSDMAVIEWPNDAVTVLLCFCLWCTWRRMSFSPPCSFWCFFFLIHYCWCSFIGVYFFFFFNTCHNYLSFNGHFILISWDLYNCLGFICPEERRTCRRKMFWTKVLLLCDCEMLIFL